MEFQIIIKSSNHQIIIIVPSIFASKYGHFENTNRLFTDGSVKNGTTGFGVAHCRQKAKFRLKSPCSIYIAELIAIFHAIQIIESLEPKQCFIFSDSVSSLEALKTQKIGRGSSIYLLKIKNMIRNLKLRNYKISLVWIPSHCRITGNEEADILANEGRESEVIFERHEQYEEFLFLPKHSTMRDWQ